MDTTKFSFDFGTRPTTAKMEKIILNLNPDVMVNDYARAYVKELFRRNPVRATEARLTEEELSYYFSGILAIRVKSINNDCPEWRQAKALYIPCFYEFVITEVGKVVDADRGFEIVPYYVASYDMDSLLEISERLRIFMADGIAMVKDAFPRTDAGDRDAMTMAIIDGYVRSMSKDAHPIASYVSAFLGAKLKEEETFNLLYRVRYDDVEFIRSMLLREATLYG